ncbi:MAG: hypothetical protein AB7F28_08625 [Candidatus Margulisiibacteriota bacterium]
MRLLGKYLISLFAALSIGLPIAINAKSITVINTRSNGIGIALLTPSQSVLSASIGDPKGQQHSFIQQKNIWWTTLSFKDCYPGIYELPLTLESPDGSISQSVTINISAGSPAFNETQHKIENSLFEISSLLKAKWAGTTQAQRTEEEQALINTLIPLYKEEATLLMRQFESYLIAQKQRADSLDQTAGSLRVKLQDVENQLQSTRDLLNIQQELITLLRQYPTTTRGRLHRQTLQRIRELYRLYFAKQFESDGNTEAEAESIKIQSQKTFQQKLTLLGQRDTLLKQIASELNSVPQTNKSETLYFPNQEWRGSDQILNALDSHLTTLRMETAPSFPTEIESWRLYLLDLKNGRSDFRAMWPSDRSEVEPKQSIEALETQIRIGLIALNQALAKKELATLQLQKEKLNQEKQSKEEKIDELNALLNTINEGIKKKIIQ